MSLKRDLVRQNLPKKGFQETDDRSHIFLHLYVDGKRTHIRTHVSHGSGYKTLSDSLVSQMAKQCKITSKEFRNLAECTLSHKDYLQKLVDAEEIDPLENEV